ncbi:MAG: hypothetical protein E7007_00575 [Alphaproteobacteria bacterium]|nr:hypothetical protein [Alphaproteobacteria bacterium]
MHLFGKKKTQPVATPIVATTSIPENHVSKKKKNTYTITFSTFFDATLFSMCKNTPLGVVSLNGQQIQNNSGWISCTEFPNPCATRMATIQHLLAEALGTKISTQIIEYLDKATGKPVVQLYPDSVHIFDGYEENYMSHLNHATRRDLEKQIALRERLINEFIAKQKQNQK